MAIVADAASAQPPFLGQGGGCSMMSGFVLAQMIDREGDVLDRIAAWEMQGRPFTEWIPVDRLFVWAIGISAGNRTHSHLQSPRLPANG